MDELFSHFIKYDQKRIQNPFKHLRWSFVKTGAAQLVVTIRKCFQNTDLVALIFHYNNEGISELSCQEI